MGLTLQPPYPRAAECRAQIVHADLSDEEFRKEWRKVPLWLRLLIYLAAPIVALRYRWFGSRESLAHGMSLDDLPRREELLNWDPEFALLDNATLQARDTRLVAVLREQLDVDALGARRIAIVYGARHMRAILRELTSRRGFYAESTQWLTAFRPIILSPAEATPVKR